ncbi:hypothetical protein NN561_009368 [Cricetulus griseus]
MYGSEAQDAAAAVLRTRRGAGADAEGEEPTLRTLAMCVPQRVPEEGLPRLGGRAERAPGNRAAAAR